ncbi:PTS system, mannose-specific IIA component [Lacrimispora sphenoides]|jgi:mannose/fructose-specific phosphotransferase system component IIA|uniref:PTS sugar transporter subunit IIA n=1 Tax=Lacrimispora sphenoides TaxID=29370 RepID=UPI0008D54780|nr:PTS mannose transporter subunit IIAB [Lacrimispora sphenoides]SEU28285.1 PTS system, mannose-specific IIA component [Lacrimispora sphenoides]
MFKIILFMHGNLAVEFIRASAMVFGEQKETVAYGLDLGCDVDELRNSIKNSILDSTSKGQEVLVLTDLMNGTPFNTMMQLGTECRFSHFTGINFPLLLEVLNRRMSQNMLSAINGLEEAAKNSVYNCDTFLSEENIP